ncbi:MULTISPECIES: flavin-containing monooxygenase [unclassified Sphingobium]|uniref:flavin-containing monooxygenase n=1 Tax=unclassified Sphingobium TaxID=2611147 RepID=UPI0035A5DF51
MEIAPVVNQIIGEIDFDPDALHAKYLLERDKRLERGARSYQPIAGELSHFCEDPHADPDFTRDPINDEVDFLLIGAGFSSLVLGAQLRKGGHTKPSSIRLIDAAADVGGTWYWNRYPGAQCDTEGYVYMPMLEDTGTMPTCKYPYQPEILAQANRIADKYNLRDNAMFQTSVTGMTWNDTVKKWVITTDRGDNFKAKYVVMATGPLSKPKLPGIPGINSFRGHTFHTCRWDYGYTGGNTLGGLDGLRDKRVGIIGTGATSIQCIPHLAASAKELYVFQRTPSCVDLRYNKPTDPEWAASLKPGWQWERMVNFAEVLEGIPDVEVDLVNDGWTVLYRKAFGPALKKAAEQVGRKLNREERSQLLELYDYQNMNRIRDQISSIVKDQKTAESLKPWYRQFCKRPTFHDTYLEAFNRPSVHLVDTDGLGVEQITPEGVVTNGTEYPLDCLIFATGFETETSYVHRAGYDVVGRDGRKLSDYWSNGLRTFFGVAVDGFPNLFLLGRTQSGASLNLLYGITRQIGHVVHMINETEKRGAAAVEPSPESVQNFLDDFWSHKRKADRYWAECTPGFFNNEGNVTNNNGFFADVYGGGIRKFFANFQAWRDSGDMVGMNFDFAKDAAEAG